MCIATVKLAHLTALPTVLVFHSRYTATTLFALCFFVALAVQSPLLVCAGLRSREESFKSI
jgi:hypothetical protein